MIDFTKEELDWILKKCNSSITTYPKYPPTLPDFLKNNLRMIERIKAKIEAQNE